MILIIETKLGKITVEFKSKEQIIEIFGTSEPSREELLEYISKNP
jgi:hypothetical protein